MAIAPQMLSNSPDRLKMLRKKLDGPTNVTQPGSQVAAARGPATATGQQTVNPAVAQPPLATTTAPPPATGNGLPATGEELRADATGGKDATPGGAGENKTPKTTEQMMDDFIRSMLGGSANTAEEEALIRELGLDAQGASLVNQRASMGRAGFASSGALGAMEGDIRRKQGQADQGAILDLRRTEDQRAKDNALGAIGADAELKKIASDEALQLAIFKMMNDGKEPIPGDTDQNGEIDRDENAALGAEMAAAFRGAKQVDEPPAGATEVEYPAHLGAGGDFTYYKDSGGAIYKVPLPASAGGGYSFNDQVRK